MAKAKQKLNQPYNSETRADSAIDELRENPNTDQGEIGREPKIRIRTNRMPI